jgi:hypothetical protein
MFLIILFRLTDTPDYFKLNGDKFRLQKIFSVVKPEV